MSVDVQKIREDVADKSQYVQRLRSELSKVIIGQEEMMTRLMIALLCNGHVLLEGVPGLAKTTAIKTLAQAISTQFRRIQFTPDLLPADLIGTLVYNPGAGTFTTRKGPIFTNFLLADEINRAPSKIQSALLEAMEERQVTIGDETYPLDRLFLVLATQNPIEQEGTYPLPEAQVDRFMLKVVITYPKPDEERKVMDQAYDGTRTAVQPVLHPKEILEMQQTVRTIYLDEQVRKYILNVVLATRDPNSVKIKELAPMIAFGGSPRASIYLGICARANAFLAGRGYVTPQDVKDVAYDVLRHRVLLTYEAEAEKVTSDEVIRTILSKVPVP